MGNNVEYNRAFVLLKGLMIDLSIDSPSSVIYALLALSEKPLTINELSKAAKYSTPRTYALIKTLMNEELVDKEKHDKGVYYYANINFINVFEKRREKLLKTYLEPLSKIKGQNKSEKIKEIAEHARIISKYFKEINRIRDKIYT